MNTDNSTSAFAARIARFVDKISYRRAETVADLDAIRHLRYTAYLKEGAIEASEEKQLIDEFDDLGKLINIGLYYDGELISALRLHVLETPSDVSPAMHSFSEELTPHLIAGKKIIDSNRFVADFNSSRAFPELPYATLRPAVMASAFYNADFATATVRAEHHAFYKRSFFASPISPPREYPLLSKKIGLMLINYARDRDRILARGPYNASTIEEQAALFAPRLEGKSTSGKLQSAA
jgi:hypothetical protein